MKPTRLQLAEHTSRLFSHTPKPGVSFDDLLDPDYWTHVAPQMQVGNRIDVMAPDLSWWGQLLVRDVGRRDAVVHKMIYVEMGEAESAMTTEDPYEVKWRGPARKFSVIRRSDKEVIRDEFEMKEQALRWIKNHMQSLAA